MNATAPLISVEHASLVINKKLLDDISLKLFKGDIVTLIGPNGAGKSSLLKLIISEYKPTRGKITWSKDCRLGYMPQRFHIDPSLPLTVSGFLQLSGSRSAQAQEQVLQEVGASHLLDAAMQQLSGGETQRILLARALIREPNLLILDEPAQALDVYGQKELYQLLAKIRAQRNCGILMVSHDLHLVMAGTDQVLCLNQHLCCSGTPESVMKHPQYQALFGNELGDSIAIYTHHHDHAHQLDGHIEPTAEPKGHSREQH